MRKRQLNLRRKPRRGNFHDFQKLEPRNLLAGISFDAPSGLVSINGSSADDSVRVQSTSNGQIKVTYFGNESRSFNASAVNEIVFRGRDGNDWFKNDTSKPSRAFGQGGDDTLIGGQSADRLRGGPGADRIFGKGGNDYIGGDDGNDEIRGESGNDRIDGGSGDDNCDGGSGSDRIDGRSGNDRLLGGEGNDLISGNSGDDLILGGSGSDRLLGHQGFDRIFGSYGDDVINGGDGADDLYGQVGRDVIYGGNDNDDLYGGPGSDRMVGGGGNDDYYSDSSDDIYDDEDDNSPDGDFELRGVISNLNTTAQTYEMLGITVSYAGAQLQTSLSNGAFVKTEGTYNGTTLQAHEVESEVDDNRDENFEAVGVISNLNTATQTFEFFGFTVNYSSADVRTSLANGNTIELEGVFSNPLIDALKIKSP